MPVLKLRTSDGEIFNINSEIMTCSCVISTLLDTLGENDLADEVIPVDGVTSEIMSWVIYWAMQHKDDPPYPQRGEDSRNLVVPTWDASFLDTFEFSILTEIMKAANYLCIPRLLNYTAKFMGDKYMKGIFVTEVLKNIDLEEIEKMLLYNLQS